MRETTSATWRGFFRPHKRVAWEQLVEAPDYSDAWGLLLAATADRRGPGGELLVSQTNPNDAAGQAPGPRLPRCVRRRF